MMRTAAVAIPVVLVKAHISAYDRRGKDGKIIHVREYDDKRMAAQMLAEHSQRVHAAVTSLFDRKNNQMDLFDKQEQGQLFDPKKHPSAFTVAAKKQKPIVAKQTVKPTVQKPSADEPPPSVTVGAKRMSEHGPEGIALDFMKLSGHEQAAFLNWLRVYDHELAADPHLTIADAYMTVLRRMSGTPEKAPEPYEPPVKAETPYTPPAKPATDPQEFRDTLDKQPEGMSFVIPQSHNKNLLGKWEKVSLGGEPWWKKGGKYRRAEEFIEHAEEIQKQIEAGGVQKPQKPTVVRATRSTKTPIRPLDEVAQAGEAEAAEKQQGAVSEGQALRLPDDLLGRTGKVFTQSGKEIQIQYAVVPRANLITSHNTSLGVNAAFPQALQPRNRTRTGLEDQVNIITRKLNPELLGENPNAGDGAPIISKDGVVESGNGRTIALGRVYESKDEKAEAYKTWLREKAGSFGLTAEAVDGIKEPVLVRIRTSDIDREAFVHEANVPTQAAMSPSEQAAADAKRLTPAMMQWFAPNEDGDVTNKENAAFVGRFFRDIVGESERNKFMQGNGELNEDGAKRLRNAVLSYVYPEPHLVEGLVESGSTTIRNMGTALLGASARLAQLKASVQRGELAPLDPSLEIAKAARIVLYIKKNNIYLHDYFNQKNLDGSVDTQETKEFLTMFADNIRKPKAIREFISTYADIVEAAGDPRQGGFVPTKQPTKLEVIEATKRALAQRTTEGEEDDDVRLFKSQGRRGPSLVIPIPRQAHASGNQEAGSFRDHRRKGAPIPERRVQAHTTWKGLRINIEQPVHSVRWWKDGDGTVGGTRFAYAYGEFLDVMGMDGDPLDCFLGPDLDAGKVYVITIMKHPDFTEEDEQKVMLGFRSQSDAENAFLLHYDDPRMIGRVEDENADMYAEYLKNSSRVQEHAVV